jgi:hypothetical protein
MRAIGRVFAALVGYILAIAAAGLFLVLSASGTTVPADDIEAARWWIEFALAWGWATSLVGAAAFVPAVLLMLVTEIAGLRAIVFYLVAGGALGAAAAFGLSSRLSVPATDSHGMLMMVAAGFVGAFVYWLVAGRMAGLADRPLPPADKP